MAASKKRQSRAGVLLAQAHALHQQGQLDRAAKQYEKLLKGNPSHPDGLSLFGLLRLQQGLLEEASELLERATQARPDLEQTWLRYGELQLRLRNLEGALHAFEQMLRIDPESVNGLFAMANLSYILERYDQADLYYLQALAKDPANSKAWANLSRLAQVKGQRARAIQTASAALDCPEPGPFALSIWLEAHQLTKPAAELAQRAQEMLEHVDATGEELAGGLFIAQHVYGFPAPVLLRARDRVQRQIAAAVGVRLDKRGLNARPRPRTLGFLSSAFHQHPVAFMVLGALEHLAAQGFRIHIYSGRSKGDAYTERFRRCAHEWHDIWPMSDAEAVERIRQDGVDVLFDLSGTSNFGRPFIPAMRAAPLQVKWVGGQSGPSGIPNMDAFLSDAVQSPPWADRDHRERLLRMPHGYVTYTPPLDAPEPALEPPVQRNGYVTFGSLNKLNKLGIELLRVWARVLNQVPGSRLLLRAEGANEEVIQNAVIETMEAEGVARERLSFEGKAGHREFLETYNRIDVALDSFPYTGGLTTCEALWMGVPVVALAGRFVAERHAATHLHNVGLGEWVADTLDEYVEKAVALAHDQERLSRYRKELREQVANSPLCDHEGFAVDLAKLIHEEWTRRFGKLAVSAINNQAQMPSLARVYKQVIQDGVVAVANGDELVAGSEVSAGALQVEELVKQKPGSVARNDAANLRTPVAESILPNTLSADSSHETTLIQQWMATATTMLTAGPWTPPQEHGLPAPLIVSLTSYPKRFAMLHLTLLCLLRQTVRPDKLILWIAESDRHLLPKLVLDLQGRGLDIRYCEDIRSYKKIIPTIEQYPDAYIAVADDDLYYAPAWLEELVSTWKHGPNDIIAYRAHRMRLDATGKPLPYAQWDWQVTDSCSASERNFPTSGWGTLYPPEAFHPDVTQRELFMRLCPTADDIWLYWMSRLNGKSVRLVGTRHPVIPWPGTQEEALWNVNKTKNDKQIVAMMDAYSLPLEPSQKAGERASEAELVSASHSAQLEATSELLTKHEKAQELAKKLLAEGMYQQALELCKQALHRAPNNPEILFLLGIAQAMNGSLEEAVDSIKDALIQEPSNEIWWRQAAEVLAAAGQSDEAENALDRAACLQVVNLAQRLRQATPEEIVETVDECEAVLRANPSDTIAFFVLTHALALLPRVSEQAEESEMEVALRHVNWLDKQPLYHHWLDWVERNWEADSPQISIIIASDRCDADAVEAVQRLREQGTNVAELIFVNNGCDDGEIAELRRLSDTYVRVKRNAGTGSGRNLGALFARAPVLLFIDDDVVPEEGMVAAHLRIHTEYDVVAVRGAYVASDSLAGPSNYCPSPVPYPAPCDLEGNVSYCAEAFYAAGGWADWLLYGHQGMELAGRLLECDGDPGKQIFHPAPKVRRDHSREEKQLLSEQQHMKVSALLVTCYRPEWSREFWRWESEHSGSIRLRHSNLLKAGCTKSLGDKADSRGSYKKAESSDGITKLKNIHLDEDTFEFHYADRLIRFWLPIEADHIQRTILVSRNFYELEMLEDIRRRVGAGAVLVDVGANIGNHVVYFGRVCEASQVYAFEPQADMFRVLERNILLNGLESVVRPYCMGLGEALGNARLGQVNVANYGMTKLEMDEEGPVQVMALDSFFVEEEARINALKVDVEGMECSVLRGASKILTEHEPLIYAEAGTDAQLVELCSLLGKYGYKPVRRFNATPTYLFQKLQ